MREAPSMSGRRWIAAIILIALAILSAGPLRAENDNMRSTLIESLRNKPGLFQRAPAQRQDPSRGSVQVRRNAGPLIVRDTPGRVSVEPTVFVTVLGDTLAELLAAGLSESFAESGDVLVTRKTRSSSGLVRDDFYDWRQVIRDMLAGEDRMTYAVIMLGSNDRQALKDSAGNSLEPFTDGWRQVYASRVADILKLFADKNVPLFWVGMPIMENPRLSNDMLALNEIVRNTVKNAGATYVDLWEPFADDQNRYSPIGPDMNGDTVRLRTSDGVNFTKLGARKAAHFVELEIKRAMDRQPPAETTIAIPADPSDPASSDPALRPGGVERLIDEIARSGIDGEPLPNLSLPVKPLAGPILALTGVEVSPGGTLLGSAPVRSRSDAAAVVERVLVQGHSPDPKPGRTDDFRWPPAGR